MRFWFCIFLYLCMLSSSAFAFSTVSCPWQKKVSSSNVVTRQGSCTGTRLTFFQDISLNKKTKPLRQNRMSLSMSPNNGNEENGTETYDENKVDEGETRELTLFEQIITASGLISGPLTLYSEYVLKTTGCGLPAGPFGLLGAAEGISYLVVVYIVGWSLYTKITTGKGLPAGNAGLLGAAEGMAYLSILTGLVVFGFQIKDYGFIPEPVPIEGGRCSGL